MMRFATPIAVAGALALGGCSAFFNGTGPVAGVPPAVTLPTTAQWMKACGFLPTGEAVTQIVLQNYGTKIKPEVQTGLAVTDEVLQLVCAYYGVQAVMLPAG